MSLPPDQVPPRVGLVVVHYHRPAQTRACLDAVRSANRTPDTLVVVDHSEDPAQAFHEPDHAKPEPTVLRPDLNAGYAAGINLGVQHLLASPAPPDLLWLLNPDTRSRPDALAAMLTLHAKQRQQGSDPAIGAHLLRPNHATEAYGGGRFSPRHAQTTPCRSPFEADQGRSLDYLCGACILVSRQVWDRVGPMDESFFLYGEDVEWGHRMAAAGVPRLVAGGAHVVHDAGQGGAGSPADPQTAPLGDYYEIRNALRLARQTRSPKAPHAFAPLLHRLARGVLSKATPGRWHRLKPAWRGWVDGGLKRPPASGKLPAGG